MSDENPQWMAEFAVGVVLSVSIAWGLWIQEYSLSFAFGLLLTVLATVRMAVRYHKQYDEV